MVEDISSEDNGGKSDSKEEKDCEDEFDVNF